MKSLLSALILTITLLSAGTASAHTLWVSLVESFNHLPGHVITMIGFGHALPVDDLLVGEFGTIALDKYELVGPDQSRFDLGLPSLEPSPATTAPTGMVVNTGDLGLRKITCPPDAAKGTYQVSAQSRPIFFTVYKDKSGKQRMAPTSIDQIKDLGSVLESTRFEAFAKSYYANQEWTEPTPLGQDLEIIPLTNLSDAHVGDLVRFKVMFKGTPLNISAKTINRMTLVSNTFGGPDKFQLDSYIVDGIAQFRLPTSGQWLGNVYFRQDVSENPSLKSLKDKCTLVYTAATVFFTVKP